MSREIENAIIIIILSISPITELLPELGISYFYSPNQLQNDIDFYHSPQNVKRQIICASMVWITILYVLIKNVQKLQLIFLALLSVACIFYAFYIRQLPKTHISKEDEKHDDSKYNIKSFVIYITALCVITYILSTKLGNVHIWRIVTPIIMIVVGGLGISHWRYNQKNIELDLLSRINFAIGFSFMIFNLITINESPNFQSHNLYEKYKIYFIPILLATLIAIPYSYYKYDLVLNKILYQQTSYKKFLLKKMNESTYPQPNFTTTFLPFFAKILPIPIPISITKQTPTPTPSLKNPQTILTLPNDSILNNKQALWKLTKHTDIMPKSYSLPDEYEKFKEDTSLTRKWVLKKNAQRQEGLFIIESNAKPTLEFVEKEKIIVAQEYFENPFQYKNHKTNIRLYMTVVLDPTAEKLVQLDLSNDGILSYATDSIDNHVNGHENKNKNDIASFYNSTNLYKQGYPILISQLPHHEIIITKAKTLTNQLQQPLHDYYSTLKPTVTNKHIDIFGIDFIFNKDLTQVKILEINKGPNMIPFGKIDEEMRTMVLNKYINKIQKITH
jgi:hypothetical protein